MSDALLCCVLPCSFFSVSDALLCHVLLVLCISERTGTERVFERDRNQMSIYGATVSGGKLSFTCVFFESNSSRCVPRLKTRYHHVPT